MKTNISKIAIACCISLGGVSPLLANADNEDNFYVTPIHTASFQFDTVDLMGGNVIENRFDIGMGKKFHLLRTYHSDNEEIEQPFGNFTYEFDKAFNVVVPYKKEREASEMYESAPKACKNGWEDIASDVFLGKLKELHAEFNQTTKLCNVYDASHKLKTTLVVKSEKYHKPAFFQQKLLRKADGTEILFYQNSDGSWSNALNVPVTFMQIAQGYKLILENGDIEIYNEFGRLESMQSEEKIYQFFYANDTLVKITDNFQHEMRFIYNEEKLIQRVISYDGTSIEYFYNDEKQLVKVVYPDKQSERYTYNDEGKLIALYRNNTLVKTYTYDEKGRVETLSNHLEKSLKNFNYAMQSIDVEENGLVAEYRFLITHSQAKIATVLTDEGRVQYTYDDNAHQRSFTDTLDVTRETQYDKDGLLKVEIENAGSDREIVTKKTYNAERKPIVIEEDNVVTYHVYDDKGKVAYKVDTLLDDNSAVIQNKIEHTIYNTKGLVETIEAGENKQHIEYDAHGNVLKVRDHLGSVEKVEAYNSADLPVESVDSDGIVTKVVYDITGKELSRTVDGKTSTRKYDAEGRLVEHKDEDGVISHFMYDNTGNIKETSESTGERTLYTYDGQNNLIKQQKYENGVLVFEEQKEYDTKHRVTAIIDAYGNRTTYSYNSKGQKVQMTDAKGRITTYTYDALGKLATVTDSDGGTTQYSYDAKGHTTKVVTPNGATFTYRYDGFGRLIEESNPDRGVTTYVYDAYDKLLSQTTTKQTAKTKMTANGDTKRNIYDALGRLIRVEYDDATLNEYYTYNKKSDMTKVTDASGSTSIIYDKEHVATKTQQIDAYSFVTQYTYTNTEKVATMTYPSGKKLRYGYGVNGELQSIALDGKVLLQNIQMKNGLLHAYSYADGSTHTRTYDLNGRLVKLSYPAYKETLGYDAVSNIVSMVTDKGKNVYGYDVLNRLSRYDTNTTAYQYFSYDANGNRLSMKQSPNIMTNYLYQANSNILSALHSNVKGDTNYIYDNAGNIISDGKHTYTYDGRNRLVGVDNTIQYEYNYENQRVSKTVDGVTTYYVYDGHKLLGEYDQEGNVLKEYIYLKNTPIAVVSKTKTYMIYADHLDTPRRVVDENGTVVWSWESSPYGETAPTGSFTLNLRFPGQYYDAKTGHHYNINRDYNPVTGRYIQSDPVGFKGGVNTYAYAEGNPVMKKDEMGLWTSGKYNFPKVHQNVNARLWGRYRWFVNTLNASTVAIDKHQKGHESYFHAMRGYAYRYNNNNGPLDSYTQARIHSENFVISWMYMSRYYKNRGNVRRSISDFGWVLHTMQDSSSPSHRYFQIWTGHESYWTIWKHVRKEMHTPSSMNHGVYRASRWIWTMYSYNALPRHGAIFRFFN